MKDKIESNIRQILLALGLDCDFDEDLKNTPRRVAKMYTEELFYGLNRKNFPRIVLQKNLKNYHQEIIIDNIDVQSMCKHHLLPFFGTARISYFPQEYLIGLSKINRIVDFFCKKPQLQEDLTVEIFDELKQILKVDKLKVEINAKHFCISMRGIRDLNSITSTIKSSY